MGSETDPDRPGQLRDLRIGHTDGREIDREIVLGDRAYSGLANQVSIDNRSGRTVSADCDMGRIEIIFEQE